jgi:hypothetical protein
MSRPSATTTRFTRHDATQASLKSAAQPPAGRHRAPTQTPALTVPQPAALHPRRARKVTPGL